MLQQVVDVVAPVAVAIPWYFSIGLIVGAGLAGAMLVQGVSFLIGLWHEHRRTPHADEPSWIATLATLGVGLMAAIVIGLNTVPLWFALHPQEARPEQTAVQVRADLAEAGVDGLTQRDTEPIHSFQRIDPEAWHDGRILERLLACDAGQFPEAGMFPAYEGFDWEIPVRWRDGEGTLERIVADEQCTFTVTPLPEG